MKRKLTLIMISILAILLHFLALYRFEDSKTDRETEILSEVKYEYKISCSLGQKRVDEYITCKEVKHFIEQMELNKRVKS